EFRRVLFRSSFITSLAFSAWISIGVGLPRLGSDTHIPNIIKMIKAAVPPTAMIICLRLVLEGACISAPPLVCEPHKEMSFHLSPALIAPMQPPERNHQSPETHAHGTPFLYH